MSLLDRAANYLKARPKLTIRLVDALEAHIAGQETRAITQEQAENDRIEALRSHTQLREQARAQARAPYEDPTQAALAAQALIEQEGYSQRAAAAEVGLPESTLRAYLKKLERAEETKG